MIEENETPGIDPTHVGIEHDLLAQRRARRAELSDPGLIRRAEAAEATVRTLETHLATLQQRLEETASEQRRVGEQLADREREVRRVKQREYAEQQLRVEAEDRYERVGREKRAEIEELHRRLSDSERQARELVEQLEDIRRELAEAQQVAVAERVAMGRSEQELNEREAELQRRELQLEQTRSEAERHLAAARDFEGRARALREQAQESRDLLSARLQTLEQRTAEVQQELHAQQAAREQSELTLGRTREGYSGLRAVLGELELTAKQLGDAIESERATLQQEFERKREQLYSEQAAEIERERERLSAEQAAQIADAQQQIATQIAELEDKRQELNSEQTDQLQQLRSEHAAELERQASEMTREHAAELQRNAQQTIDLQRQREQLESRYGAELEQMRDRVSELEAELEQTASELRRHEALTHALPAEPQSSHPQESESSEALRKREMKEALAAAVERLRARVELPPASADAPEPSAPAAVEPQPAPTAAVKPPEDPSPPAEPSIAAAATAVTAVPKSQAQTSPEHVDFAHRLVVHPPQAKSWLAPAIRSVADNHDAKLAGELVIELIAAQRLVLDRPLNYVVEIEEIGGYRVHLDGDKGTVEKIAVPSRELDFVLKGKAADFSELAGGGAGRRLSGLKVRGSKRRARKLLAARRPPLKLSDLASAEIRVWPGLLLLAMAEAIDPAWTVGQSFVAAFEVLADPSVTIYVRLRDGEPVHVSRAVDEQPQVTATVSELGLVCLLAGVSVPAGEDVKVSGEPQLLGKLLDLTDRAQGLIAAG